MSQEEHQESTGQLSNCIAHFIEKLPEEYRTIIKLSELDGVSQKDIAEKQKVTYVTRSKIRRDRGKLRGLISNCCAVIQGGSGSIINYESKYKRDAC